MLTKMVFPVTPTAPHKRKRDDTEETVTSHEALENPQHKRPKEIAVLAEASKVIVSDDATPDATLPNGTATSTSHKRKREDLDSVDENQEDPASRLSKARKVDFTTSNNDEVVLTARKTKAVPKHKSRFSSKNANKISWPKSGKASASTKKQTATLGDLPAEILELIAWYSLAPAFSLTSKRIFDKLGHMKDLRQDMAMVVFRNWDLNESEMLLSRVSNHKAINLAELPLQSSITKSGQPTISQYDIYKLQQTYCELSWCTVTYLREIADAILMSWLDCRFTDEEFSRSAKEAFVRLQHLCSTSGSESARTTDGKHILSRIKAYYFSLECSDGGSTPVCTHRSRSDCPKHTTDPDWPEQSFCKVVGLPSVPERVVADRNNTAKEENIRFFQGSHPCREIGMSENWEADLLFAPHIREAFIEAVHDDMYNIQRRLLNESIYLRPACQLNRGRVRRDLQWCTSARELLALLACAGQWCTVMTLSTSVTREDLLSKGSELIERDGEFPCYNGLGVVDGFLKQFLLTQASRAAHVSDDATAYEMMEWWIKDESDEVPPSWLKHLTDVAPNDDLRRQQRRAARRSEPADQSATIEATNEHALREAKKKVLYKLQKFDRQARMAPKISDVVAESMRYLARRRSASADGTSSVD
ncbi:hypothetical protein OHC33_004673 [Knufia fluminis]|uniref:Uncharacterized protein n=1 Tax=Knufia fluminis TaxID=191047 RepID=A0AAN8F9T4_9EURO|nr:hypothetical protein OHC33_004673 [Knufia fluminis]